MRKIVAVAFVALFVAAATAQAQAPTPPPAKQSGFTMALRAGYAIPMGDFVEGAYMKDFLGGSVPVWVDLGYRIDRSVFVGAYFQYAFGTTAGLFKDLCVAAGVDCTATTIRIGAEIHYKFSPEASFAPWVGAGIGYESTTFKASGGVGTSDAKGFEPLNFQVGGDFNVSPAFALGPYVAFSLAIYESIEGVSGLSHQMHEWLQFGLKGTFNL